MPHNPSLFLIESDIHRELLELQINLSQDDASPLSQALNILAMLGGVASIAALKKHGVQACGDQLKRSFQRSKKIRPLGGGYFALHTLTILSVETWITRLLHTHREAIPVARCVELILAQYPHGDRASITRWLGNRHSDIRVCRGLVTLA